MPLLFKLKASISVQNLHLLDLLNRSVITLNLPASARIGKNKQQLSCGFFALQGNGARQKQKSKIRGKGSSFPAVCHLGQALYKSLLVLNASSFFTSQNFPVTFCDGVNASPDMLEASAVFPALCELRHVRLVLVHCFA